MKTQIFYFTGTGNSLYVAKNIAEKINECEVIPIAKSIKETEISIDADRIGFVLPLYFSGLPRIAYNFINKIQILNAKYIFAVITAGFPITGASLSQIKRILRNKSLILNSGFYIQMNDNYIINFDAPSKEKQLKSLLKTDKKIENIVKIISNSKNKFHFEFSILTDIISKPWNANLNKLARGFYILDSCNSCRTCAKICPVDNIIMIKGKPTWNSNCEFCFACINNCPKNSIQYGQKTINRTRYRNPKINLNEIMEQKD